MKFRIFIFAFLSLACGDIPKNILLRMMSKSMVPMFSTRNFMVSGFTFKSLIYLDFLFVYDVKRFFACRCPAFPNTLYWKNCLFPTVCSCILCHRLIAHMSVGSFLGFLFCFIDLCVCFCAILKKNVNWWQKRTECWLPGIGVWEEV